jgi:hypothetical protein
LFRREVKIFFNFVRQLEEDLVKGEKKLLIQILHFLITKINELKKRYYLNKFSSNVKVSEEYEGDEEIIELLSKYRELQADFSSYNMLLEEKRQSVPVLYFLKIKHSK